MVQGREGDHGGVIRGKLRRGKMQFPSLGSAEVLKSVSQGAVSRDPPRDSEFMKTRDLHRPFGFFKKDANDRFSDGCAEIGHPFRGATKIRVFLQKVANRGLQAAKAEIEIAFFHQALGELMTFGIAAFGQAIDLDAARIGKSKEFRRFVKGLARRIVQRPAQHRVVAGASDVGQLCVAAAHQQREMFRDLHGSKKGREQVSLKMIDRQIRNPQSKGEALGVGRSDEQGGCKTGTRGRDHGTQIRSGDACFLQGASNQGIDGHEMIARGHLRYHAAEACMEFRLRGNQTGEDDAGCTQDRHGRLIAGGLDC